MDAIAEITEKKCRTCGHTKAVDAFGRATTNFGGDGYMKDCRACKKRLRAEKAEKKKGGGGKIQRRQTPAGRESSPHRPSGFRLHCRPATS